MKASIPLTRVTLDSSTAIKLTMSGQMSKERGLMSRNDVWHRVKIVRGARYDKEVVLRSILQAVEPADLIPVRYQVSGDDAYFMARNCGTALDMLCRSNLIINLANGDPIVIIVTLAFASIHDLKINIQPILLAALTRCYDTTNKSLKLDDFHKDEEVAKTVYCPLSQTKTLSHTLKLAKTTLGPFVHLSLRRNELMNTNAFVNSNLSSLRGLDLRNNYLMAMNSLAPLKTLQITELWLDGNPLCENYANNLRYIDSAKSYCPHLKRLDGVMIDTPELPLTYANYFTNNESRKLAHQFIDHFYNFYDHNDKSLLRNLYHRNALFSVTFGVPSGNSDRQNFAAFTAENRNIFSLPDYVREQLLYRGPDKIIGVLKRLPQTLHDRKSFKIDVAFADRKRILLNVDGIFKSSAASQLFSFSRTFLLVASHDNEYNILNDQLHVNVTTATTSNVSFDDSNTDKPRIDDNIQSLTPREEDRLIYTIMNVTTMNDEWCRKFLSKANWNARKAIKMFIDSYESSRIPAEAFTR